MTMPHVPQIPSRQSWVEGDRILSFEDQIFVDGIQHFQKRHVRADVRGAVRVEASTMPHIFLPPHPECKIHYL